MAESKRWKGQTTCDLCKREKPATLYDAKTHFGPWGTLCRDCFVSHGVGLGTGKGQEYRLNDDGKYLKTAG